MLYGRETDLLQAFGCTVAVTSRSEVIGPSACGRLTLERVLEWPDRTDSFNSRQNLLEVSGEVRPRRLQTANQHLDRRAEGGGSPAGRDCRGRRVLRWWPPRQSHSLMLPRLREPR